MIKQILQQQIEKHPYPLLFVTISGAHLYGFPSPDSDYDLRGVHILPASEALGLWELKDTVDLSQKINGAEIDFVTYDVKKFFELILKKNGQPLEAVFSPLVVHTTPEHAELKEIARESMTRHHVHHYMGFARGQWNLFQKEQPPRVKPLLYVYRVLLTGIYLMETGLIEANLVTLNEHFKLPYLPELVERKLSGAEKGVLNDADMQFHIAEFTRLMDTLYTTHQKSALPEDNSACKSALNDLLVQLRLR